LPDITPAAIAGIAGSNTIASHRRPGRNRSFRFRNIFRQSRNLFFLPPLISTFSALFDN